MQFTEGLFIDLLIPHIEDRDLISLRRISRAIKNVVDPRIFASIKNEMMRIRKLKRETNSPYISRVRLQSFAYDSSWYPTILNDHGVLLHFIILSANHQTAVAYRYNLITRNLKKIAPNINPVSWPRSGFIQATIIEHDNITLEALFAFQQYPSLFFSPPFS